MRKIDRAIVLSHESEVHPRARVGPGGSFAASSSRLLESSPQHWRWVGRPAEKSIRTKVRVAPSVVPPSFLFFTLRVLFLLAVWFIHVVVAAAPMHLNAQAQFTLVQARTKYAKLAKWNLRHVNRVQFEDLACRTEIFTPICGPRSSKDFDNDSRPFYRFLMNRHVTWCTSIGVMRLLMRLLMFD